MNVVIANRQRIRKINTRLLKQIVQELFLELEIHDADLGINLVATPEMTLVNKMFLQHEGSTDVITFDHNPPVGRDSRRAEKIKTRLARTLAPPSLHGELFICVEEAVSQAKEFKTSWQSEVVRYIVHGVLHLLGNDDLRGAARRKMKREENRLVRLLARRFSLALLSGAAKLGA